ncbi:MAG: hypothetical protein MZV63_23895 [Marinilabiliales bacterium]|nr:hypothetical protein [Marinilabiliales bacterium]
MGLGGSGGLGPRAGRGHGRLGGQPADGTSDARRSRPSPGSELAGRRPSRPARAEHAGSVRRALNPIGLAGRHACGRRARRRAVAVRGAQAAGIEAAQDLNTVPALAGDRAAAVRRRRARSAAHQPTWKSRRSPRLPSLDVPSLDPGSPDIQIRRPEEGEVTMNVRWMIPALAARRLSRDVSPRHRPPRRRPPPHSRGRPWPGPWPQWRSSSRRAAATRPGASDAAATAGRCRTPGPARAALAAGSAGSAGAARDDWRGATCAGGNAEEPGPVDQPAPGVHRDGSDRHRTAGQEDDHDERGRRRVRTHPDQRGGVPEELRPDRRAALGGRVHRNRGQPDPPAGVPGVPVAEGRARARSSRRQDVHHPERHRDSERRRLDDPQPVRRPAHGPQGHARGEGDHNQVVSSQ